MLTAMSKKLTLGNRVRIVEKRIFAGSRFSVNTNGGMGGGHGYEYVADSPDVAMISADANGMVKARCVDGSEKYINLRWCDTIEKIYIMKIVVTETRWNGKYGSDSDSELTGRNITKYVSLGRDDKIEIVHGTGNNMIASFDGVTSIHEIKPED